MNNLECNKAARGPDEIKRRKRTLAGSRQAREAEAKPVSYRKGRTCAVKQISHS